MHFDEFKNALSTHRTHFLHEAVKLMSKYKKGYELGAFNQNTGESFLIKTPQGHAAV